MISGLIVLRERVLEPLIRSTLHRECDASVDTTSSDQRQQAMREQMEVIFRDLGLAA